MLSWHLFDLVNDLGQVRFVPDVVDPRHRQPGSNILVALAPGHVLGNLVGSQLLKVAVPDPTGVDPVGIIGVEEEGKTKWLRIGLNHVEDLVEAHGVLDQDDRNLLTVDIDDLLTTEDPFVGFEGVLDLLRSYPHEAAQGVGSQGVVDVVESTDTDCVLMAVDLKGRVGWRQLVELGDTVGQLRALETTVGAEVVPQPGIGPHVVPEDVLTLRTEQTIGVGWGVEGRVVFMVEAVVDDRVGQVLAVEELLVPVGNDRRLGGQLDPAEDLLVGCVDLPVAVHLVAKDIGKDEGLRGDVAADDRHVGFVDLQHCQPLLLGTGSGNEGRHDSLFHVGAGGVGEYLVVLFSQNADAQRGGQGLPVGPSDDDQVVLLAEGLENVGVELEGELAGEGAATVHEGVEKPVARPASKLSK